MADIAKVYFSNLSIKSSKDFVPITSCFLGDSLEQQHEASSTLTSGFDEQQHEVSSASIELQFIGSFVSMPSLADHCLATNSLDCFDEVGFEQQEVLLPRALRLLSSLTKKFAWKEQ